MIFIIRITHRAGNLPCLEVHELCIVFSERTQGRRTTVFSPTSGERNVVGQPFFHQLRANAMSWGNCSFTKFGRTQCRGATVHVLNCTVL
ncbi:uncharacterized protein [Atheta coriaria]|uniref:uncharacterized protein isoform X2 n=1 Tax=Dalotia coriaria TaxID=877792 RepID=UPI0031F37EFB